MRALGDKIEAKRLAEQAGVPVAAWSGGPVESAEDAVAVGEKLGYPLMIKAAAGGGGRGMRRVTKPDEMAEAFERARAEAKQSFGDPSVLIESLVGNARHVEVQLMADGQGGVWALGVRDCSYQRRHQKVVEESASPALTAEQERDLAESAVRLARNANYRGAGTVEFLYEPEGQRFSFMEVNARLQVEHPVTEMVTGADLVRLQLHVAAGGRLEGDPPPADGHAIEVRLNAEDPGRGFAPAPGRITLLRLPSGPGVRVDTGVAEGDSVPPEFDSMIAKIIAHGATREQAIARLRRAVADTMVVIDEGTTNQGFLLELLGRPELRRGEVDTGWLDRLQGADEVQPVRHADTALIQAAIALCDAATADRARALLRDGPARAPARRGRHLPHRRPAAPRRELSLRRLPGRPGALPRRGRRRPHRGRRRVGLRARAPPLLRRALVPHHDRAPGQRPAGRGQRRPAPRLARRGRPGAQPRAGRGRRDPRLRGRRGAGRRRRRGDGEHEDGDLARRAGRRPRARGARVRQRAGPGRPPARADRPARRRARGRRGRARDLRRRRPASRAAGRAGSSACAGSRSATTSPPAEAKRVVGEVLAAPPDLERRAACSRSTPTCARLNRPHAERERGGEALSSPQEHLHAFLRSLDAKAEGLPDRFVAQLERALGHLGVTGLERTAALEDAAYRLFLAQQRAGTARDAVRALLARRLEQGEQLEGDAADAFRGVLDRLEAALAPREPALAELARELRWRCCDRPAVEAAREETYAETREHLAALAERPDAADREAHLQALVDCPQPLARLLTQGTDDFLLEALTRRYYRIRALEGLERREVDGVPFLLTTYVHEGTRHHVAATFAEPDRLPAALAALATHAGSLPDGEPLARRLLRHVGAGGRRRARGRRGPAAERGAARLRLTGRGPHAVDVTSFTRGEDGALERGPRPARPASADGAAHGPVAARELRARAPPVRPRRLPLPRPGARQRARRAPRRRRRGPRPHAGARRRRPHRRRCPTSSASPARRSRRCAPTSRGAAAAPACSGTACCSTPGPRRSSSPTRPARSSRASARMSDGLGIEMVQLRVGDRVLRFFNPAGRGVVVEVGDPPTRPLQPLDEGGRRIVSARRRGMVHPAEIIKILAPQSAQPGAPIPPGEFTEYDLDDDGRLVAVDRPVATNRASIVVGVIRNRTERYPEGMQRVVLLGDPTRGLGSLAEPECSRVIAALDLAEELDVPVEWFALSSGARIAMDSGTENMDWVAAALRRIVGFTQAGGEINVVVTGINVGAQPYWNAEATMLMHTKGILVMTPESAMVLTGKQALDYSGGVSAEDNFGIGGYERVMGPNGQAQYRAPDLAGACEVLLNYYEHAYVAPGERFPRRAETTDPSDRDVGSSPHEAPGSDLTTVGEIFAEETNPGRKKPFDIRAVMRAVADADHPPLERWAGMREAEIAVTWDAHLGGWPVVAAGHRVPAAVALRLDPGRRARAVDVGHAVPARLQEGRARDQRRVRAAPARRARQPRRASTARPSRCGGCSSSTAPRSGARS